MLQLSSSSVLPTMSRSAMSLLSTSPLPAFFPTTTQTLSLSPLKRAAATNLQFLVRSSDTAAGVGVGVAVEGVKQETAEKVASLGSNGVAAAVPKKEADVEEFPKFGDLRWVNGTWDLHQFKKDGGFTDWDSVIDAEVRRRKWLQLHPETSSNEDPVTFDTSIIPWWSWVKRFHLPEAELLNGRAAMIGFFMGYFVDSLTGVGLVDQTGNFFCKTLLLLSVLWVLFIRKNEDLETIKKLLAETTFYDKQWQATWQEDDDRKP